MSEKGSYFESPENEVRGASRASVEGFVTDRTGTPTALLPRRGQGRGVDIGVVGECSPLMEGQRRAAGRLASGRPRRHGLEGTRSPRYINTNALALLVPREAARNQ